MASVKLHKGLTLAGTARIFRRYLMLRAGSAHRDRITPAYPGPDGILEIKILVDEHHSFRELALTSIRNYGVPAREFWQFPSCKLSIVSSPYDMRLVFHK